MKTDVEEYWTGHLVQDLVFLSAAQSEEQLAWRFDIYPLFRELSGLWGDWTGKTILDYGCGPANDVTGFLRYGNAKKVYGLDVSGPAIHRAISRMEIHGFDPARYEFIKVDDIPVFIPLESGSVDHVNCQGVLHHVSDPLKVLTEFHRVLKPGGTAGIMVYNRASIYFHLTIGYEQQILNGMYPDVSTDEAYRHFTDGTNCPVATPFAPSDFLALCEMAGFSAEFRGGYFIGDELAALRTLADRAIEDERLAPEHRRFLENLDRSEMYARSDGYYAGNGGTYWLTK